MRFNCHRTGDYERVPSTSQCKSETVQQNPGERFCHNIDKYHSSWDALVQPPTYRYNTQIHSTTRTSLFSFVLSRIHPLAAALGCKKTTEEFIQLSFDHARLKAIERMLRLQKQTDNALEVAKEAWVGNFKKHVRRSLLFRISEWIYLNRPPVWKKTTTKSALEDLLRKLASKKEDPYRVINVQEHIAKFDVKKVHITISVDKLALALDAQRTSKATIWAESLAEIDDQPLASAKQNSCEHTVHEIINNRRDSERNLNELRWIGYTSEDDA